MPDTKLSALPAGSAVASADLFYSVQGGVSVSQAASALKTFMSGMAIGGAVTGGTAGEALVVGAGPVLAQTTSLPVSVLNSGTSASSATFWRGDGTWANTLTSPYTPAVLPGLRAWYQMD